MLRQSFPLIKICSIAVISIVLILEIADLWLQPHQGQLPVMAQSILLFGRIALVLHGIEGIIAAVYAPSRQKHPLSYGLYTFFTGFVGLVELFDLERQERLS